MRKWLWFLINLKNKLWIRLAIFTFMGVVAPIAAYWLNGLIPQDLYAFTSKASVDSVLKILANSMLVVTAFSMTTMITAYNTVSSNATPRSTKLLVQDSKTQNALSTFLGSFIFSLVAIITFEVGLYGDEKQIILLALTIFVVFLIILTLVRWMQYLVTIGRIESVVERVEDAAFKAVRDRVNNPFMGGREYVEGKTKPSKKAVTVKDERIGYVQNVDMKHLQETAEEHNCKIYVQAIPGAFNDSHTPLALVEGCNDAHVLAEIADSFIIDDNRTYEQDPVFGLIVMSEIASRALSPAVNDPGTAISIIKSSFRVLAQWNEYPEHAKAKPKYPNVYVPPITLDDLFDGIYTPIGRDGAGVIEVQVHLQKAFNSFDDFSYKAFSKTAKRHAKTAYERAMDALHIDADIQHLKRTYQAK